MMPILFPAEVGTGMETQVWLSGALPLAPGHNHGASLFSM